MKRLTFYEQASSLYSVTSYSDITTTTLFNTDKTARDGTTTKFDRRWKRSDEQAKLPTVECSVLLLSSWSAVALFWNYQESRNWFQMSILLKAGAAFLSLRHSSTRIYRKRGFETSSINRGSAVLWWQPDS
jgi:hypothetical protein